jgi:hypothetical protein
MKTLRARPSITGMAMFLVLLIASPVPIIGQQVEEVLLDGDRDAYSDMSLMIAVPLTKE